jgi:hypothetical protein
MGQTLESYADPLFRRHLLGGTESVAGLAGGCLIDVDDPKTPVRIQCRALNRLSNFLRTVFRRARSDKTAPDCDADQIGGAGCA